MPYRTFLPYNAAGGVLWASAFVFAGYLAGNSYQRIAEIAGRAGLLLAIILVVGIAFALVARWVARHPDRALEPLLRVWQTALVQRLAHRYARQVAFLSDRLRPGAALGLLLTAQLTLLATLGAAFGAVLDDVVRNEELISIDGPVARFVVAHREPWLTRVFEVLTWAGSAAILVPVVAVVGLWLRHTRTTWGPLIFLAASLAGATVLSTVVKLAVGRPRPVADALANALGYAFPSGHATAATAGWLSVAIVLSRSTRRWPRKVALVTAAILIAAMVGLSRVYLGVHEPTDVLGGWALGSLWVAAILVTDALLTQRAAPGPDDAHKPLAFGRCASVRLLACARHARWRRQRERAVLAPGCRRDG
jgi:undecaprenyl-diphosphatase